MDCKIKWTDRAWLTYNANLNYLENEWTSKEINRFVIEVDKRIESLSKYPRLGKLHNRKYTDIRLITIHRRVLLIYKYMPNLKEIHLLVFWNTSQNPEKLKV